MDNFNEKFGKMKMDEEALEQVSGGERNIEDYAKSFWCPRCRCIVSEALIDRTSGIPRHSKCGEALTIYESKVCKACPAESAK